MNYNVALYINDESYQNSCIEASSNYSEHTVGYLLSKESTNLSYPHVTLCQFKCDTDEKAIEIFSRIQSPKEMEVKITQGTLRLNPPKTALWIELSVEQDETIIRAHLEAVKAIGDPELCLTKTESYNPHISIARLIVNTETRETVTKKAQEMLQHMMESKTELIGKIKCKFVLGLSDKNGQLTKILTSI